MRKGSELAMMKYMELFGVRVDAVTLEEVVKHVANRVGDSDAGGRPMFIVTPNPEQVVQAQADGEFRQILNSADLSIPDGFGLVWASIILAKSSKFKVQNSKFKQATGHPFDRFDKLRVNKLQAVLTERVSGMEVMEKLIERAAQEGWKVMLLGGREGVAGRAAEITQSSKFKIQNYNSKFKITGIQGITDIRNPDREEERRVIEEISEFGPDLLFVGCGAPWQEKWVARQLKVQNEKFKVKCVMVVGGAIDQIVDGSLRPPRWLDHLGLGWLYRLMRQPWRWKRQLRLLRFGWMVFLRLLRGDVV